jgi:ATP-dependent Lhr-like helicase
MGLQFASAAALRRLEQALPDATFWINATDPISPCELGLEDLREGLPRRVPATTWPMPTTNSC